MRKSGYSQSCKIIYNTNINIRIYIARILYPGRCLEVTESSFSFILYFISFIFDAHCEITTSNLKPSCDIG